MCGRICEPQKLTKIIQGLSTFVHDFVDNLVFIWNFSLDKMRGKCDLCIIIQNIRIFMKLGERI